MKQDFSYVTLVLLLIVSIILLLFAPDYYSEKHCIFSFVVFVLAMGILLTNNIRVHKSFVLFESFFSISFFLVNYVYPIYLYQIDPYFSLFAFAFNENVMTRCTALATVGYVSFCLGIYQRQKGTGLLSRRSQIKFGPLNSLDIGILFFFYITLLYSNLDSLRKGITMEGSGGGFFFIFALFYIYKYFAFTIRKASFIKNLLFWGILVIYIITNFALGNRGEPLYLLIAILFCYHKYYKHISFVKLSIVGVLGLLIFYFVGKTRISSKQLGTTSREERIDSWEREENVLMYANEFIINNRSLFALVDYTDNNGYSFGKTWSSNFFSVIPFGQSFALYVIGIKPEEFSTNNLNTSIIFEKNDFDRFGLGTNLIGDIYVSLGSLGVLFFMFLFGRFVMLTHNRSLQGPSYYQLLYMILIALSFYYPRASLFSPLQAAAWNYALLYIANRKIVLKRRI